ncbi:hypothetical protein PQX77_017458 [Marasmius sp. AFHP31]|nr:hypothetical protein PQX77_017458 [Marasmius sp. AFHP31]
MEAHSDSSASFQEPSRPPTWASFSFLFLGKLLMFLAFAQIGVVGIVLVIHLARLFGIYFLVFLRWARASLVTIWRPTVHTENHLTPRPFSGSEALELKPLLQDLESGQDQRTGGSIATSRSEIRSRIDEPSLSTVADIDKGGVQGTENTEMEIGEFGEVDGATLP